MLSYQGNSEEVGCYVAGCPLSKQNCYFEVTIVDSGVRGSIAVGLVPKFYRLDHQPGWLPYSVAYHADNGKLYNGNPVGQQFGPKCARGDRIGCGIQSENIQEGLTTVFFTKNRKEVGSVEVPLCADGLFPAVGMHSLGEEVKVDLQAHWFLDEEDSMMMMVDSHEDDWGRLYDVRVSGTNCLPPTTVNPSSLIGRVELFITSSFTPIIITIRRSQSNSTGGSRNQQLLEYVGKGKSIMDVGLAQARQPLTTRCHYYEVEIIDAGEKCYIALGLARRDYPKNRHPGWSRGSVAYHADDGKIFHGSGVGDAFGPRCFKGDIMGCGIMFPRDYILDSEGDSDQWEGLQVFPGHDSLCLYHRDEEDDEEEEEEEGEQEEEGRRVTVFFTRNGKLMGRREVVEPEGGLFPTVGMLSSGEKVKVDLHPLSG
ncbi:SPRY domain-containing protein 3 isoform X2 [Gouania willdenowi]|nr:SPRY domain-containing protein 3-like isoform X2 [Gouania willdenowi]